MLFSLRNLLRCLRKILSVVITALFCDLLLRVSFILLFFVLLPFFIVHDHVIPSALLLARSTRPIVETFFGRLLPSLLAFVFSLLPPVAVYYFTKHIMLPGSIKIIELIW